MVYLCLPFITINTSLNCLSNSFIIQDLLFHIFFKAVVVIMAGINMPLKELFC